MLNFELIINCLFLKFELEKPKPVFTPRKMAWKEMKIKNAYKNLVYISIVNSIPTGCPTKHDSW